MFEENYDNLSEEGVQVNSSPWLKTKGFPWPKNNELVTKVGIIA